MKKYCLYIAYNNACTRVSKGRDVPRDVPGQSGTGRPVVPLSRDKKVSLSRRPFVTRTKKISLSRPVPDFDRLSQPVPSRGIILSLSLCPETKITEKQEKDVSKQETQVLKHERMF